jgi:hypothetical protein
MDSKMKHGVWILGTGALLALLVDGCALTQDAAEDLGEALNIQTEGDIYFCDGPETAGHIPHAPNEKHCCMTHVAEHQEDKKFELTDTAGDKVSFGVDVPNYITAEIKGGASTKLTAKGRVVRSLHAEHEAQSHCATHTATEHGQCKEEYVRSRYDLEGEITAEREGGFELGFTTSALLKLLPVQLEIDTAKKTVTVTDKSAICVSAPHHHEQCSGPTSCVPGTPGCAVTDGGTQTDPDAAACDVDSGECSDAASADPCSGLKGTECFNCCENNASSGEEVSACIAKNQC